MQNSTVTLETLISKETLKKSLVEVIIVFIILFIVSVIYVVHQNNKLHEQSIIHLTEKLDSTLINFQEQVDNLAKNDLIINSIVDDVNRDNYLPVFFRSLKLNNSVNTSIVFTDYTGKVITGKNTTLHQQYSNKFNWQDNVLSRGLPYFEFSEVGLFAASPVLLSNYPEGAIISYVSDVQKLIPLANSNATFIYINNRNKVLYSSNNQLISRGSLYTDNNFIFWFKNKQPYLSGHIVSIEPPMSAYRNILWLVMVIIVSLIFIFLGLMSTVKSAAKHASHSMQKLQNILADPMMKNGNSMDIEQGNNEPVEFFAIRKEFNTLLNHLFNQTISLQKFTSVINSLDEILFVLDEQNNIILNNSSFDQFCKKTGITLPQDIAKIIPYKKSLIAEYANKNIEIEYPFINQEDPLNTTNSASVQWNSSDYIDSKRGILGIIFVGKDVTLAKKLEVDLLIKNQAIDSAKTSIIITDAQRSDNPIIYANKSFCELTGFSINEVIGKNCRFLQGENTQQSKVDKINKAISQQTAITTTLTNYKKDGCEFKNELTMSPIVNEKGIVTHFLGIQSDVTEREETANYLTLAKQKAEESTQLKSEFLASMSHEIRTPMNGVIGMLDLLLRSKLDHEQYHNAEIAKDSANSLLTIINDILDFSKIESGKLEIENAPFNLVSLFSHVSKAHAQHAHNKGVELIIDTSGIELALVTGDSGRIRQILNNLLSNAIKFTEHGSVIVTATVTQYSSTLVTLNCQVSDTGIGIAEDRLEQVFSSFTQADSSTTRLYGGTGLGLAITEKLCQLMKGSVNVTSKKQLGSSFNFTIQLGIDNNTEKLIPINLSSNKILILDIEEKSANALKKQLNKWGATVVIETNKQNYNHHIENGLFDMVFIDESYANTNQNANGSENKDTNNITANENSAIELVKNLPSKYKTEIAFILMTKVNENHDKTLIINAGFRCYFSKPATPDTLNLALEEVLNKKPLKSLDLSSNTLTKSNKREVSTPILLVEDNRTNQLVAKKLLSELGGEITIANNGKEAIDILNNRVTPFKLIFMDCQMPILDGYQATEQIRAGAAGASNKTLPIIAMTANAMKGDREKCLIFGMDDYVSKPINIDTLRKKIDLWLR